MIWSLPAVRNGAELTRWPTPDAAPMICGLDNRARIVDRVMHRCRQAHGSV